MRPSHNLYRLVRSSNLDPNITYLLPTKSTAIPIYCEDPSTGSITSRNIRALNI
jgi:hypothetical protein